jgi:hypothetical protein
MPQIKKDTGEDDQSASKMSQSTRREYLVHMRVRYQRRRRPQRLGAGFRMTKKTIRPA